MTYTHLLRQIPLVNLKGPRYPDTAPAPLHLSELRLPPAPSVDDVFAVWLKELDSSISTAQSHDQSRLFEEWYNSNYSTSQPPGMDAMLSPSRLPKGN